MTSLRNLARLTTLPSILLLFTAAGAPAQTGGQAGGAQTGPGTKAAPGISREAMWPAPTAEDWKRPCLITWQRTFEDAVAVARETSRPILICVNMDGEIASEHYAGIRYREPEIAALYDPYITVIASVYRHTPRDYDEEGRRILCPRFGSVTCGEHISIEPGLYDKYFEGERVAPRHIMIELDGAETYDVYYAFDTASVFQRIHTGITEREIQPKLVARGDLPVEERVDMRHIDDRRAVEQAYEQGDRVVRRRLLQAAIDAGDAAPVDLLRLAVFGFDLEMSQLARQALAKCTTPAAIDLINEALRVPMEASRARGAHRRPRAHRRDLAAGAHLRRRPPRPGAPLGGGGRRRVGQQARRRDARRRQGLVAPRVAARVQVRHHDERGGGRHGHAGARRGVPRHGHRPADDAHARRGPQDDARLPAPDVRGRAARGAARRGAGRGRVGA